jgi:hypothetical protein
MSNITRVKKGETIVSAKVLVTCTVTIVGQWSHSAREDWADDDNGMKSAETIIRKRERFGHKLTLAYENGQILELKETKQRRHEVDS